MRPEPLPHDVEAECAALACVLDGGPRDEAAKYFSQLCERHFHCEHTRLIFRALAQIEADGTRFDSVALRERLLADGTLKRVGDATIAALNVGSAAAFPSYLAILDDRAARREAIAAAERAIRTARDISQQVQSPSNGLPDLIDAAAFLAAPLDPPAELVAGILHRGSKLVFGGGSKSFKTWCLLDLAISVATGAEWLGRQTMQGRVLFVNFEIQPHAWQGRLRAVAEAKGVQLQPGQITLWNLRGHAADFKTLVPKIIERARREGFALIVLDPIYKLYGGTDENAAGDVAALLNSLERLATTTGAAIAFGAHFAKGNAAGKEAIDRISGSGVFARDPDSLLIFTRHETDDAFVVEPILRNFAPVAPFTVRWEFPLMRPAGDLDPAKLKQAGGRKPENVPDDLLKLLPAEGLSNPDFVATAEEDGISKRTFYRLRKSLEKAQKIMLSKVNGKWMPISSKNKP